MFSSRLHQVTAMLKNHKLTRSFPQQHTSHLTALSPYEGNGTAVYNGTKLDIILQAATEPNNQSQTRKQTTALPSCSKRQWWCTHMQPHVISTLARSARQDSASNRVHPVHLIDRYNGNQQLSAVRASQSVLCTCVEHYTRKNRNFGVGHIAAGHA